MMTAGKKEECVSGSSVKAAGRVVLPHAGKRSKRSKQLRKYVGFVVIALQQVPPSGVCKDNGSPCSER